MIHSARDIAGVRRAAKHCNKRAHASSDQSDKALLTTCAAMLHYRADTMELENALAVMLVFNYFNLPDEDDND